MSLKSGYRKQVERESNLEIKSEPGETEREKDADVSECPTACDSLRQSVSNFATASDKVSQTLRQLETEGDREVVIAELKNRKKRMSYRELSQKFGVSKDTISRIITENGQGISDEILKKISEKL
jgi:DNA-binding Xre family transcriptional regulator